MVSDQLLGRSVHGTGWECKWRLVTRVPRPRWAAAMAILQLGESAEASEVKRNAIIRVQKMAEKCRNTTEKP